MPYVTDLIADRATLLLDLYHIATEYLIRIQALQSDDTFIQVFYDSKNILGIALEIVAHNLHLFRFTPRFVVFVLLQQLIHINHPLIYLNNSLYCPKVIGLLLLMIVPCIMQIFSYNIQCSLVIKRIITKMLQNINVFTFHHQLLS